MKLDPRLLESAEFLVEGLGLRVWKGLGFRVSSCVLSIDLSLGFLKTIPLSAESTFLEGSTADAG